MKWGSHVSLKATFSAKVIASNTVGAFDFHLLSAHGTLAVLGDPFHIQEDVQVFITSDQPLSHWCLNICQSSHPNIIMVHIHSMKEGVPPCQSQICYHFPSQRRPPHCGVGVAHNRWTDG
jgi:hypothetical protein